MVFSVREVPRGVGTRGHLEDLLCYQLIHGKRAAKGIRPGVFDAQDIKGGLDLAVFAHEPWRAIKVMSASRHSSITLGPK